MFKVIQQKQKENFVIYTSDSEFDAINVAIRNTESGINTIIKDDYGVVYETFSKEDLESVL